MTSETVPMSVTDARCHSRHASGIAGVVLHLKLRTLVGHPHLAARHSIDKRAARAAQAASKGVLARRSAVLTVIWSASFGRGDADQIGAHLPEHCSIGLVVAALGRSLQLAVGEVAARHVLEIRRGRDVN